MKCENTLKQMSLYIDNELEGQELKDFKDHLNHCTSCQIELKILKEIIKDINELDEIDLPEGFHEDLMEKIRLENQTKQNKVIQIPKKDKKLYQNWRVLSGVAAAFVFSLLIFDIFNINPAKDSLPESISIQPRTANIQRDMPQEAMPSAEGHMADGGSQLRIMETQIPSPEIWEIHTKEYEVCKKSITQISQEMELEKTIMEDIIVGENGGRQFTIEITLNQDEKTVLKAEIAEVCIDAEIDFNENDLGEEGSVEILVITINEIK